MTKAKKQDLETIKRFLKALKSKKSIGVTKKKKKVTKKKEVKKEEPKDSQEINSSFIDDYIKQVNKSLDDMGVPK